LLTRAALSTGGRAKSKFLSVVFRSRELAAENWKYQAHEDAEKNDATGPPVFVFGVAAGAGAGGFHLKGSVRENVIFPTDTVPPGE
jgi:hypothetical protein